MSPELRDLSFEVLSHFGLEHLGEDAVLTHDRHKNHADARAVIMWVARQRLGLSFPEIGRELQRDHSTVMVACEKVEREIRERPEGAVTAAARAVLTTFRRHASDQGRGCSGARELNFGPVRASGLELDQTGRPFDVAEVA